MSHSSQSIEGLLSELRALGIVLLADGENLRVSAPKNALTPMLRQQVATRKTELLTQLRQEHPAAGGGPRESGGVARIPAAPRQGGENRFPLSFSQQRLWFLDQLEPGGSTWNIPAALRLEGRLNLTALHQTLSELSTRHEVLRTTFDKGADQETPWQRIAPPGPFPLSVIDLTELDADSRAAAEREWIRRGETHRFELATGPLLWVTLLKRAPDSHLLLLTLHHIIADGWSVGVLIHEVATLYRRFAGEENTTPSLPPLPVQYADYALWQRSWLEEGELDRQLAYWQQKLAGAPALLELPTDRPRPAVQSFVGAVERFTLSASLTQGLKRLSREQNGTLFMTLLGGFAVLLSRYSTQKELVIGSPVANRNRAELEGLIGFFVNTLVLRVDLEGEPTFRELLEQLRHTTLEAYAHQDVPFEHLVERLRPTRTRSHSPLFQVMFILQNTPESRLELPELSIERLEQEQVPAKYDLLLGMEEQEASLQGEFEYNTDLFDATTIRRMIGHLTRLLEAALLDPDRPCSRLPL
ncbi:MAG: non-ribosomal peptide synthetase, partial [Magnetococcales bacterium]|nr:non-ribosomal peptide synthetase [Magnetococcales bacterium]